MSRQKNLDALQSDSAETLSFEEYRAFLDKIYSHVIDYYSDQVPGDVLSALLSLRYTLQGDEHHQYLFTMPHRAAFQILAAQLLSEYQVGQQYGMESSAHALLEQAKYRLSQSYGDSINVIIDWFGINNLLTNSDVLILLPSTDIPMGSHHSVRSAPLSPSPSGFIQLIQQLFAEYQYDRGSLISVEYYPIGDYLAEQTLIE